LQIVLKASR